MSGGKKFAVETVRTVRGDHHKQQDRYEDIIMHHEQQEQYEDIIMNKRSSMFELWVSKRDVVSFRIVRHSSLTLKIGFRIQRSPVHVPERIGFRILHASSWCA